MSPANLTAHVHISLFTLLITSVCLLIAFYLFNYSLFLLSVSVATAWANGLGRDTLWGFTAKMRQGSEDRHRDHTEEATPEDHRLTSANCPVEICRFIGMRCQCESMLIDVYTHIYIYMHVSMKTMLDTSAHVLTTYPTPPVFAAPATVGNFVIFRRGRVALLKES